MLRPGLRPSGVDRTTVADVTPLFPQDQPSAGLPSSGTLPEELAPIDLEGPRQVCLTCGASLSGSTKYRRLRVCPACGHHYTISARRRIAAIADDGSFSIEWDDRPINIITGLPPDGNEDLIAELVNNIDASEDREV
ncbi:MAG: hypothetical protein O6922_08615, partial [Chloroflexi bacterium]|nr:hypothetical protein [Chloroflexota bacterium]